jgi:hypothetical protein
MLVIDRGGKVEQVTEIITLDAADAYTVLHERLRPKQGAHKRMILIGSLGWNRTNDQRINSPTLYR